MYRVSQIRWLFLLPLMLLALPAGALEPGEHLDLTGSWVGITSLIIFVLAYVLVISEEFLHLRKSKPVIVAAGIIWGLVGFAYAAHGPSTVAEEAVKHNIMEYGELFLFLLAAMTYINTMEERRVFEALRAWLINRGLSLYSIYWITGFLAFIISPWADNLTTALLMSAVALAVAGDNKKFITVACINIVVGANAGGAFSPFGDITTLMVWQKGVLDFNEFFDLFVPALVNWVVPALLMSFVVPRVKPAAPEQDVVVKHGGFVIIGLFFVTIAMAVMAHNYLNLPPVLGMMTGLGLLKFYGFYLRKRNGRVQNDEECGPGDECMEINGEAYPFDIYHIVARAEWDTLMFFYGVVLCVGGLGTIGYLAHASHALYEGLGPTWANILIGVMSSIVDNIPVMFAVLTMNPHMSDGQWLLVTLTAGVGGSLLSIGSAAGVALMGQARGVYTFFGHLKWTWAVALGYVLSIWVHFMINGHVLHMTHPLS